MLLSMTGFGEARRQTQIAQVSIEVRSVNNRHFKLSLRAPDVLAPHEADIEKAVREVASRGTISIGIRLERGVNSSGASIHRPTLERYFHDLRSIARDVGAPLPSLTDLLELPGVVEDRGWSPDDAADVWAAVSPVLTESLAAWQGFRQKEGAAMLVELNANAAQIASQLSEVSQRAPQVVVEYRDRLMERLSELLASGQVAVDPAAVLRETSLFADRCDIREEIARLESHLAQYDRFVRESASAGRKLEFLSQEMLREINTIGSKANNVAIAHAVVEMKAAVERLREMLANVE